jgi:hypothetical protein
MVKPLPERSRTPAVSCAAGRRRGRTGRRHNEQQAMCEPPPVRRETPVSGDVADRRDRPLAKRQTGGRALPERSRPGTSPRQRRQLHRLVGVQLAAGGAADTGAAKQGRRPSGAGVRSLRKKAHRRGPERAQGGPRPPVVRAHAEGVHGFARRWACGPTIHCAAAPTLVGKDVDLRLSNECASLVCTIG